MANYHYRGILETKPSEYSKKIASDIFFEHIPSDVVPEKCLNGTHSFFYYSGEANLSVDEANTFFIYNSTQGFLYEFLID